MIPQRERRQHLARHLGNAVAIIPNSHLPQREDDPTRYYGWRYGYEAWRPDSDFLYLTGFREPESVLVVIGGEHPRSVLFCRSKDADAELWFGRRLGPEAAREALGVDEAWPIEEFDRHLPTLLAGRPSLYYPFGVDAGWDQRVYRALNALRGPRAIRNGAVYPVQMQDVRTVLHEMRLRKDNAELRALRRAAAITSVAHCRAMRAARAGSSEYEVEAELLHEFRRQGAHAPSYNPIVASGANACILHYVDNTDTLRDGDLLLIDAGCEVDGYCADVTRTFPVGAIFNGPQRDLYELVLSAQLAGIACLRPGVPLDRMHQTHIQVIAQGLIDLGLLQGSLDSVIEREAYKRYFMHGSGHYLGLDTHDAGRYHRPDGAWRDAEPGMVLTVEPGIYVRPADDVPDAFWHLGIRIEDDVLVTAEEPDVLTADVPKTVEDIEAFRRSA